jgi:hypothetical protein
MLIYTAYRRTVRSERDSEPVLQDPELFPALFHPLLNQKMLHAEDGEIEVQSATFLFVLRVVGMRCPIVMEEAEC